MDDTTQHWDVIGDPLFEIPKYASIKGEYTLYPHQSKALEKMHKNGGHLLVAHGTGLGKTLTSIAAAEDALDGVGSFQMAGGNRIALAIVPAGLRVNFVENVKKFTRRKAEVIDSQQELDYLLERIASNRSVPEYLVMSWALMRNAPEKARQLNPRMVVFDEMDTAKSPKSSNYRAARIVRQGVPGAVGLAASFVSNSPDEIPPLLAITTDGQVSADMKLSKMITEQVDEVKTLFGKPKQLLHVNRPDIVKSMSNLIDYVDPDDVGDMPDAVTEYIPVEMSKEQHSMYNKQVKELPKSLAAKIVTGQWFSGPKNRVIKARQAAQSTSMKYGDNFDKVLETSPKVSRIADDVKLHLQENPRHQVVIYANFVESGVRPIHEALKKVGIPHSVFIGKGNEMEPGEPVSEASRNKAISDFKAGKSRVVIISGAGAKGLDLKTGSMFMAAEGHFNPEVIRQAQARIRRLGAHKDLPKKDRTVQIRRYVSVEPAPGLFTRIKRWAGNEPKHRKTTDEWMYDVARAKHFTNEGVRISLSGNRPLMPGQQPPKQAFSGNYKYTRKWRDPKSGEWRYEYPDEL